MITGRSANPASALPEHRPSFGISAAIWHPLAPRDLQHADWHDGDGEGWAIWIKHLGERRRPAPLGELLASAGSPLSWALPDGFASEVFTALVSAGASSPWEGRAGEAWEAALLARQENPAGDALRDPRFALESLAGAHALPRPARLLSPGRWWGLLEHLFAIAERAASLGVEEAPLAHQLLAGELPLSLAYLFPEIEPCRRLAVPALKAISAGLDELLDGEGLPHGRHLPILRPLLACWTRCRAMAAEAPGGAWTDQTQAQYAWLVRHSLRLARSNGTHSLCFDSSGDWRADMFAAALRLGGNDADRDIASLALPRLGKAKPKKVDPLGLPEAALHSEWAATAVLRPRWRPTDPQLTVVYCDGAVRTELRAGREVLWSGAWGLEVRVDGVAPAPPGEWEETCWISDESVDYLELEGQLGGGVRVQRHLLLAREDHFLLAADSVLLDGRARLEYAGVLPLVKGVSFLPADESREGFLAAEKRQGLVLPLALPEWRADPRVGSLAATSRGLELRQAAEGRALFAPLFIDLDPRRLGRPLTWRTLTVAEDLAAQPPDIAVGYRVRVGSEQWLVYRSLGPKGNRTLLGHNLVCEMLVAEFDGGEVETLLEIE